MSTSTVGTTHPALAVDRFSALDREVATGLLLNDLGEVHTRLAVPVRVDPYADPRSSGTSQLIGDHAGSSVASDLVRGVRA